MELKSEKSIKEYLKKLPDDTIIKYYLDVEYSPFPILVIEEYTRRFKRKTKSEILKDIKLQANLAKKKTKEISSMAKKYKFVDDRTKEKSQEIIKQAKKKGYEVSEKIINRGEKLSSKIKKNTKGLNVSKKIKSSNQRNLELLEKLEELKKAGVITNKEFQEKKKQLLSKI